MEPIWALGRSLLPEHRGDAAKPSAPRRWGPPPASSPRTMRLRWPGASSRPPGRGDVYVLYASVDAHLRCKLLVNGATLAQKEQRITELEAELAGLKAGAT